MYCQRSINIRRRISMKTLDEVMSSPEKRVVIEELFDGSINNPFYFYIGSYTLQQLIMNNVFVPSDLNFSDEDMLVLAEMFS